MRRPRLRRTDQVMLLLVAASLLSTFGSAGAADYYVDPGDEAAYATVQAAVDAVAGESEFNRANIFIAPGSYRELITVDKPFIGFICTGSSPDATTISFPGAYFSGFTFGRSVDSSGTEIALMARHRTMAYC